MDTEKGRSTPEQLKDLSRLGHYLFRKLRKIIVAFRSLDKRLWEIEEKCSKCELNEAVANIKIRLRDVEKQCRDCQHRRTERRGDLRKLIIGILVAIISGVLLWYLTH